MLKIISVKGENFRSFKSFDFEIKSGLWVVKGDNKDDSSSDSNGSGKSTLFCDSIIWCLTGSTVEPMDSDDDVVNLKTKKNCWVEVLLNDGEHVTKIMRTRKHTEFKNNLFLEIDGQSLSAHRIKDTQERVNQIIKISPSLLKSTIIMAGDISNRFSELTPKDRISLLESVRDYKVWADFREESKTSLNEYLAKIEELKAANTNKAGQLDAIVGFVKKLTDDFLLEKGKTFSEDEINSLESELKQLEATEKNTTQITELEKEVAEKNTEVREITEKHNAAVNTLNSLYKESSSVKYTLQSAQNNINQYSKLLTSDSVCPTCGQKVVMSEEKRHQLLESLVSSKKAYLEASKKDKEILDQISNASVPEPVALPKLRQAITDLSLKIQELSYKDKEVEQKINFLRNNIKTLKDNWSAHETRLLNTAKQIEGYKGQIFAIQKEIEDNKATLEALDVERDAYQFFYDSLGPKGNLRPYLLRKDIVYLNKVLQYYTARIYPSCSIKIRLILFLRIVTVWSNL